MRRFAVLGMLVGLAATAIAAAPPSASASAQTTQKEFSAEISHGHQSFPWDSLRSVVLDIPQPARVSVFRADSAGHQLLVMTVRPLPNPAALEMRGQPAPEARSTRLGAFASNEFIEPAPASSLPFPIAPNRQNRQGFSSALRSAVLIGTLIDTGRFYRSRQLAQAR